MRLIQFIFDLSHTLSLKIIFLKCSYFFYLKYIYICSVGSALDSNKRRCILRSFPGLFVFPHQTGKYKGRSRMSVWGITFAYFRILFYTELTVFSKKKKNLILFFKSQSSLNKDSKVEAPKSFSR